MSQVQITVNGKNVGAKELELKLGNIYDGFKSSKDIISNEGWAKLDPKGHHTNDFNNMMNLFRKVASQVSKEEFVTSFMADEIPAVKLTAAEMEVLKGGFNKWIKAACIGAATGLAATTLVGCFVGAALEIGSNY